MHAPQLTPLACQACSRLSRLLPLLPKTGTACLRITLTHTQAPEQALRATACAPSPRSCCPTAHGWLPAWQPAPVLRRWGAPCCGRAVAHPRPQILACPLAWRLSWPALSRPGCCQTLRGPRAPCSCPCVTMRQLRRCTTGAAVVSVLCVRGGERRRSQQSAACHGHRTRALLARRPAHATHRAGQSAYSWPPRLPFHCGCALRTGAKTDACTLESSSLYHTHCACVYAWRLVSYLPSLDLLP